MVEVKKQLKQSNGNEHFPFPLSWINNCPRIFYKYIWDRCNGNRKLYWPWSQAKYVKYEYLFTHHIVKNTDISIDDGDGNGNDNGKKIITGGFTSRFCTSRWRFNKFEMRFVIGLIKDVDRNMTFSPEHRWIYAASKMLAHSPWPRVDAIFSVYWFRIFSFAVNSTATVWNWK